MNPIALGLLKMALPLIEKFSLDEWQSQGIPALQVYVDKLSDGHGKEEASILLEALDKIVKFEATRSLP